MITLMLKKINSYDENYEITQDIYDASIEEIDFDLLKCSCDHDHCLSKHAYYARKVKSFDGVLFLRILRVKCNHCHRTHAILLSCIVPYSQILLRQILEIVMKPSMALCDVMIQYDIDEAHIRYIKKQFRLYWKERIDHLGSSIQDSLSSLCFNEFKRQFMQIRNMTNIPFHMKGRVMF